jgi:hypothetical protein
LRSSRSTRALVAALASPCECARGAQTTCSQHPGGGGRGLAPGTAPFALSLPFRLKSRVHPRDLATPALFSFQHQLQNA